MFKYYKIIIVFAIFAVSIPAVAQVGELRNNFSIGVNAGVNFNTISFTPKIKQKTMMGYAGGITARYISEKYFAMICGVQAELNYTQRGWEEYIEDSTDKYSRTMNYLEVPFLAHLAFGRNRGVQFFLNLGPQVAFLISESESYGSPWSNPENPTQERPIAQYEKMADNKFDYGIVGGAGLELRTKAGNFLVEGRYYFALSDIYGNAKKDPFSRSAHSTLLARITYLFDLKK